MYWKALEILRERGSLTTGDFSVVARLHPDEAAKELQGLVRFGIAGSREVSSGGRLYEMAARFKALNNLISTAPEPVRRYISRLEAVLRAAEGVNGWASPSSPLQPIPKANILELEDALRECREFLAE